jgi:serpin B
MVVDRPFLFVIHDLPTATPLFIGRITDPSA